MTNDINEKRRIIFINYAGIGNGIILLPIIRQMELDYPQFQYYHISNPLFENEEFLSSTGINNFRGCVPSIWRRFKRDNWEDMETFIENMRIDTIVNLRSTEILEHEPCYSDFKQVHSDHIDFIDMSPTTQSDSSYNNIRLRILDLLRHNKLIFGDVDFNFLSQLLNSDNHCNNEYSPRIGFFTGASQFIKKWNLTSWIELGKLLLDSTNGLVFIYAGSTPKEKEFAFDIARELQRYEDEQRIKLIHELTIYELAKSLSTLTLLISNDTVAIHLAAALNISAIGLYFSTDSNIWGGYNSKFTAIQSQSGLGCAKMRRIQGNCTEYYGNCTAPCKDEITPKHVWSKIKGGMLN